MQNMAMIAIGAALGANARHLVSQWAVRQWGVAFPYGTLIINVLGSLLIGVLMALFLERMPVREPVRLLLITGLLGGFTTFSAFSNELYGQIMMGNYLSAGLYVLGSVGGGLVAVMLGMSLVRMVA